MSDTAPKTRTAGERRSSSLSARVKALQRAGLCKRGVPFAWAYCTSHHAVDRRAVGYVLATTSGEAKHRARVWTNYFAHFDCEGHPGVYVWPDPELKSAPIGAWFRFVEERIRFTSDDERAAFVAARRQS